MIRRAETDSDLAAVAACWGSVRPDDPVSAAFLRERLDREPERLYLIAEADGRAVATAAVARASRRGVRPTLVAVLPEWRRRGLGGALLDRCLAHARALEAHTALGTVCEDDAESRRFVETRGFVVEDRLVSLSLDVRPGLRPPTPPGGIEIVELEEAQFGEAYAVFCEGAADIPASEPQEPRPFDDWTAQLPVHPLTLVALDSGHVVGYADLELRSAERELLDNNLTTVRRSHRGRGIAEALKRTQIAWASERGFLRIITATHDGNKPMRRLNEKLGYRQLPAQLDVTLALDG